MPPPPETDCPECGFVVVDATDRCPKCETPLRGRFDGPLLEADVVHAGETYDVAIAKLDRAVDAAVLGRHRGVKVIHGYGSGGAGGSLKQSLVARLHSHSRHLGGKVVADRHNRGATILYLNVG